VITEAGNDPRVAGLVYITAFAPDKGESVASLIANPPPGAPVPPILPPQDGYLFLDRAKFPASFAADVDAEKAAFMADSQVPWGLEALGDKISEPAWKAKPSWYLIATDDKMIPPDAQRSMSKRAGSTVVERVPPDVLCDPNVSCGWTDYRSHEALPPIWSLPSRCWTGEDPIIRLAIFCVTPPRLQSLR
jgi:hypothetical protein